MFRSCCPLGLIAFVLVFFALIFLVLVDSRLTSGRTQVILLIPILNAP